MINVVQTTLNKVYLPPRQRKEVGDLEALGESIQQVGQIQTIAARKLGTGDEELLEKGYLFELLAGGRRLLAMRKRYNEDHSINVTVYPTFMSVDNRLAVELAENTERENFTWQEESALKKKIHNLFMQAHKERKKKNPKEPDWSQDKTAKALGVTRSLVTTDLGLADALETMPELFEGVKDRSEASNLLAKLIEKMATEELAKRVEEKNKDGTLNGKQSRLINSYHLGDFFEWAKKQLPNQYDLVEFDPDYGVDFKYSHSARSSNAVEQALRGDYQSVSREVEQYTQYLERALEECYRLAKTDAWLILWFAQEPWFEIVFSCLERSGWNGKRIPGVWFKDVEGRSVGNPDRDLGRVYETFFYGYKGDARINRRARGSVFTYSSPRDRIHPTEKPASLYQDIYSTFCKPGSKLLIPHLGSGNGIFAASFEGMSAEGCDLNNQARSGFIKRVMEMEDLEPSSSTVESTETN